MRVLVFPDLHIPWHHRGALEFLKNTYKKHKCDTIVCLGDEVDFHNISFHRSNPNLCSASEELEKSLVYLKEFYKAFPKVKVCTSNHTSLPFRRALDCGLPSQLMRSYREFLKAPKGWEWRDEWMIDGVSYIHGEALGSSLSALKNAVVKRRINTVFGHLHSEAGLYFSATNHNINFAMNCGCLVDAKAIAFEYAKAYALKPVLACGVVLDGVPSLIPMPMGDNPELTIRTKRAYNRKVK